MNIVCFSLSSYEKRVMGIDDVSKGLVGNMTETEKYMMESHEVIEIRGKVNNFCILKLNNDKYFNAKKKKDNK